MRLYQHSFVALLFLLCIGCGGESATQTMDTSEIESYVNENPEAVAQQAKLEAAQEDVDDDDE